MVVLERSKLSSFVVDPGKKIASHKEIKITRCCILEQRHVLDFGVSRNKSKDSGFFWKLIL